MNWLLKEVFPLRRVDKYLAWALGLGALVLYLALPVRVISYDSLAYAMETTSSIIKRHFHPHHLLFSRTQLLFLYLCRFFDSGLQPLATMAWFNSVLGGLTLTVFYRTALRLSGRRLLSSLVTIVLGLSWTYYYFASSGDTVILPNLLLLLALYLVLDERAHNAGRLLVIALLVGFALLYHQMSIFYLPLLAIVALRSAPRRQLPGRILLFTAFSLGLAVVVYLVVMVFYYQLLAVNSWWSFLTADTRQSSVWGSYNPWDYAGGAGHLLNSGNYAFSIVNPEGDELWWALISRGLCWALLGLTVVMIIMRAIKREWFGVMAGGSLLATMTFINWWEAPTTDYWVLPWMLVLLLLAWAGRGKLNTVLVIWLLFFIPAQLTVNWYYRMAVFTDPQSDLKGRAVSEMIGQVTPGKAILLTDDANLALRAEMAGVRALLFPHKIGMGREIMKAFLWLYNNPKNRNYQFLTDDSVHNGYYFKLRHLIPQRLTPAMDAAFARATPLVEVSDRWGLHLNIWLLGR
jgi:hypothetical protein